jgi:predicted RNA binding protein YcfA (HicA-like mRNA interferase family)
MPKNISWRKMVQKLKKLGFDGPCSGGRHLFMLKGKLKLHIPNLHKNDISKHLIVEIIKQADISPKEWDEV